MRLSTRAFTAALFALAAGTATLEAQREDSFRWFLGAQTGVLFFETPAQTRAGIPTAGAQALIIAKRSGLLLSIEEGFGSSEVSSYADASAPGGFREVQFNRIRKYSGVITAFPFSGSAQPYFGVGFGILHTVHPDVQGVFSSSSAAAFAQDEARTRGSTGFGTLVAGVQFKLGKLGGFGQYQVTTSPAEGKLFTSATHTLVGGVRLSLGSSREGVRGGGY